MNEVVIPLFKSHYYIGRSILTLEKPEDMIQNGPDSIIQIAKEHKLDQVFLIEDSMSGFLQAYKNLQEENIKLIFGLKITVCPDMSEKNADSLLKSCKYVIVCKNTDGYKRLIKIFSTASKQGFYYEPRIDFKTLESLWKESDLQLCVPFYDSFLFKNLLTSSICVPSFSFTSPTFFIENNGLPFDYLLKKKVTEYAGNNNFSTGETKSVYYKSEKDFKPYLTFRCINNRSTLDKPQLEHMCSNSFSFESCAKRNGIEFKPSEVKLNIIEETPEEEASSDFPFKVINPSKETLAKAKQIAKQINNSRKEGHLSGSILKGEGTIAGIVGELGFLEMFGGERADAHNNDVYYRDKKIEVKTKQTGVDRVQPDYEGTVKAKTRGDNDLGDKQDCDYYAFMRYYEKANRLFFCGYMSKQDFEKKKRKIPVGKQDGNNGYVSHTDQWNVFYKDCKGEIY